MADRETFGYLKQAVEEYSNSTSPYFIGVYSEGTHAWFDSPDIKYQDGKNIYYNRFYNMDKFLGEFIEWFVGSQYSKNTILIITGDHASYADKGFQDSFHAPSTPFIDRIPLWIWYSGVTPRVLDARGKNNLDLAPTILHILDKNISPSWMLGCSLFDSHCSRKWQYLSAMGREVFSTKEAKVLEVHDAKIEKEIFTLYSLEGNGLISN